MTVQEIVSDEEVENAFIFTDFGNRTPKEVIMDTLMKIVCEYEAGRTAYSCCSELGLITYNNPRKLTKKGKQYLYAAYSNKSI